MRFNGTIKKWNDEKGFGFIQPSDGGIDLFVHISEFPKNSTERPKMGDLVSFEVITNENGKKKAVKVQKLAIPDKKNDVPVKKPSASRPKSGASKGFMAVFSVAVIAGLVYLYDKQALKPETIPSVSQGLHAIVQTQNATPQPKFVCDGRKHCSQMTSCAEAKYFLNHCPMVEMDGDHDGIPCEMQWCTH